MTASAPGRPSGAEADRGVPPGRRRLTEARDLAGEPASWRLRHRTDLAAAGRALAVVGSASGPDAATGTPAAPPPGQYAG